MFSLVRNIEQRSVSRLCCCKYATSGEPPTDHHKRLDLHDWPKSRHPTAYEVFGLSSKDISMSTMELSTVLKQRYVKLVKIYHPDTSLDLLDEYGQVMSDDTKRKRFDLIQESYDILKNPRRRGAYNRYQTTSWDQQGRFKGTGRGPQGEAYTTESFEAFRRANAHRTRFDFQHDEAFWSAGTWNDYYQMKYKRPPPTREEFDKNKYKILMGVLAVGALSFGLQFMNAIDRTNQYLLETHRLNLKSMKDLNQSYAGAGDIDSFSEADNVRKFLISRRSSAKLKHDDMLESGEQRRDEIDPFAERRAAEPSDHELLVKYAQNKVNKWSKQEKQWANDRRED
ncbi:uncharacterized protein LODBEIA_P02290 [Lodderomyces beijingensis]|uniref:J domain-containing protein n=1 Tax=Lodderomyces beijingensis TaxID=1775926 RepID=A0ABP0ZFQ0_9ASCO